MRALVIGASNSLRRAGRRGRYGSGWILRDSVGVRTEGLEIDEVVGRHADEIVGCHRQRNRILSGNPEGKREAERGRSRRRRPR